MTYNQDGISGGLYIYYFYVSESNGNVHQFSYVSYTDISPKTVNKIKEIKDWLALIKTWQIYLLPL